MKDQPCLLIVDDEKNTRDGVRRWMEDHFDVYVAADAREAMNVLEAESVDVMLTDLRLGADNGMELLSRALSLPKPPVCLMMTAYGSVDIAVEAMRHGAYDYVTKPLNLDKLELLLKRALRSREVESENRQLKQQVQQKFGFDKIIGNSAAMQPVYERVRQVANTRVNVLIEGESGTGKELIAQALHQLSSRSTRPLVIAHCAALSPTLLASELFGHEKGAFTGAQERRIGRFEEANHGTLFLDEIGEIDHEVQVMLLRALGEQRAIQRVGSNQTLTVDVRVVAATNKDLEKMVADGKFREDLYYRLNGIRLRLPPLRERREDIPLLLAAFLKEFARESGKKVAGISPEAREALMTYSWPGNVRELRSALESAMALAGDGVIGLGDLPDRVVFPGKSLATLSEGGGGLNLEQMEKRFVTLALQQAQGSRTDAAKLLGISRRTLHRKLHQFGLEHL
jgi:DNA-binding NtrC family response regulator